MKANPNLLHLIKSFREGKRGADLEGSSRSGKTWSGIDFIVYLCSKVETSATINILRDTYNSFKTTLYDDFNERLPHFGISSPFVERQEVASFKLFGNKINLMGCDKISQKLGSGCDYFFGNEAIHIPKPIFDQTEMRCRKFWWLDYNPEGEADHYIFKTIQRRPDVAHLRTTFLDNPFCPHEQKKKILSYCPWHLDDLILKIEDRRPHPENWQNGTADQYMWDIYGTGKRADRKGKILTHWKKYKDLPEGAKFIGYGIDFGFSEDPAAIVGMWEHREKIYTHSKQTDLTSLYFKEIVYEKGLTDDQLGARMKDMGFSKSADYIADSADPKAIQVLRDKPYYFRVQKAYKGPDSVEFGIKKLKSHPIYFHENSTNLHYEGDNYLWKMDINENPLDVPIDKHNHAIDAIRYITTWHLGMPKREW